MKEIKLTDKDYTLIKSFAVGEFIRKPLATENTRAECIIDSFLAFIKQKGYTVVDGKIYKNEEQKPNS